MRPISEIVSERPWVGWALFIGTLVAVFLIGLLGASIIERRQEAFITQQVKPLLNGNRAMKFGGRISPGIRAIRG